MSKALDILLYTENFFKSSQATGLQKQLFLAKNLHKATRLIFNAEDKHFYNVCNKKINPSSNILIKKSPPFYEKADFYKNTLKLSVAIKLFKQGSPARH